MQRTYRFNIRLFVLYHLMSPLHEPKGVWRYTSTWILLVYEHQNPTKLVNHPSKITCSYRLSVFWCVPLGLREIQHYFSRNVPLLGMYLFKERCPKKWLPKLGGDLRSPYVLKKFLGCGHTTYSTTLPLNSFYNEWIFCAFFLFCDTEKLPNNHPLIKSWVV